MWKQVLLFVLLLAARGPALAGERTRVYMILIDGFDGSSLDEQLTPTLWKLSHGTGDRATYYARGRAVMPTVTNTNHAALLTASYPAANGILGNRLWDRVQGHAPEGSEFARFLEVETLFTVVERERPRLTTAALFGKSRLVGLFDRVEGRQERPDILWGDVETETETFDAKTGFGSDRRTMNEALKTLAHDDPDLLIVALPDVDRTEHLFGPDSPEARRARMAADREIERFIAAARRRETWAHTVLFVTADHGMQSVAPDPARGRSYPLILFGRELMRAGLDGVLALSRGGIESIYVQGRAPSALDVTAGEQLAAVRRLALTQPEIAEAWYRLANPADGGDAYTLDQAHPDWHLDHPQIGEMVLVARPHFQFGDPFEPSTAGVLGNHGGPEQSWIPILVTGGDVRVRAQVVAAEAAIPQATNPDIGATALWLLGVRATRQVSGRPVTSGLAGRVLREAFE